jgi:hypothetical protein
VKIGKNLTQRHRGHGEEGKKRVRSLAACDPTWTAKIGCAARQERNTGLKTGHYKALFVAEGDEGVDAGGAAGGEEAREQGHEGEQGGYAGEGERVGGGDAKE